VLCTAISESHLQREYNGLILERVAMFLAGLEDLHEKKGLGRAAKERRGVFGGGKSRRAHLGRARLLFVEQVQLESACRTTNQ